MPSRPRISLRALGSLKSLGILDTPPEAAFDAIVEEASRVTGAPIALISLLDFDRQWFKANRGLEGVAETPREISFCGHAVRQADVFVVNDARGHPLFRDNPLVTGPPNIVFYAGVPIELADRSRIGTLCVIDHVPRELTDEQITRLKSLTSDLVALLQARSSSGS